MTLQILAICLRKELEKTSINTIDISLSGLLEAASVSHGPFL